MKIVITRSYSRKIQLKQFEPFEAFCSAQAEFEAPDLTGNEQEARMKAESAWLDAFCRTEVAKTIEAVRPSSAPLGKVDKTKSKEQAKDAAENEAGAED